MVKLVDSDKIEAIVGVKRHPTQHWARAVSEEEKIYILHSRDCLDSGRDLTQCPYSLALDRGIDADDWTLGSPVQVIIAGESLVPIVKLTRQDFAEWADNEGGIYELLAGHGIDINEFDETDIEFIELLRQTEAKAFEYQEFETKLAELVDY